MIFPLKQEPYLQGVPCMESGIARIEGGLAPGIPFPAGLTRLLLPPAAGASPAEHPRRPPGALGAARRPAHPPRAAGRLSTGGKCSATSPQAFDLALDARLFLAPEDVQYLLNNPPRDWSEEDRRRAAYLIRSGLVSGPLDQPLSGDEVERMLLALAELLHVVRREDASLPLRRRTAGWPSAPARRTRSTTCPPGSPPSAAKETDLWQLRARHGAGGPPDPLLAGGAARRRSPRRLDLDGVAFDRSSPYSSWTRFRTDSQIAAQVNTRFPGFDFPDLRDPGARRLRPGGEDPHPRRSRQDRWRSKGSPCAGRSTCRTPSSPPSAWSRGTVPPAGSSPAAASATASGMCQVGSYGMAQRGHTYKEILTHYYTGVELGRARWRAPTTP